MQRFIRKLIAPRFSTFLLKNARVVNSDLSFTSDVLIEHGKIAALSSNLTHKTAKVIDCTDKMLIPGGIDPHVHMEFEFMGTTTKDNFDSGSNVALAGGTTSFIDFAIPNRNQTLSEAYNIWRSRADGRVNCDYALHSCITNWKDGQTPDEMKRMVEKGISTFKFFMAYKGALDVDTETMMKAFEVAKSLGALVMVHAEAGDIIHVNQQRILAKGITGPEGHYLSRPQSTEAEAVHRAITIAENVNCPLYIVHLFSKEAVQQVMRAKNRGVLVYAEVLAGALGTDGTKLWDKDWNVACRYVNSPCPSPDPKTKIQLMKYLNTGMIDVIATDNCTFSTAQKAMGRDAFNRIPNGLNGLQDRLSVVWTKGVRQGLISQNQFVETVSTKTAQIFNLYPRKGIIREGSDADVVIWDPNFKKIISAATHHHGHDFNIFQGLEVYGRALHSFSNGQLVWDGKNFLNQHKGKYLPRGTYGYPFRRHAAWTKATDPLNFVVDRSGTPPVDEVTKLKQEISKLQKENSELSSELFKKSNENKSSK